MCTTSCPCAPSIANGTSKGWFSNYINAGNRTYFGKTYDIESYVNLFNRTLNNKTGYTNFTFSASSTNTSSYYTNFWDCYNYVSGLQAQQAAVNPKYNQTLATVSTDFVSFARDLENTLNCNGICYPGLFYYFKTVYNGIPTQNCLDGITKILAGNPLGMGILLLISFILTIFVHFATWSMCCKCCAPKESKDNWEGN